MRTGLSLQVKKAALISIGINVMQIIAVLALLLAVLIAGTASFSDTLGIILFLLLTFIVIWGAIIDISQALKAGKLSRRYRDLGSTVDQMDELNRALRAQRHDFLNHLQVVYSLIEMEEYQDARDYIDKVYGDIQSLSVSLRTKCSPVNALLRVKLAECEKRGVKPVLSVTGAWEGLPVPAWELCRVLGNLIDNALDALKDTASPRLEIAIGEDLSYFRFSVKNNGPRIPDKALDHIFDAGFSSKGEGRGMGLYISRNILREARGELMVESDDQGTSFSGILPKSFLKGASDAAID